MLYSEVKSSRSDLKFWACNIGLFDSIFSSADFLKHNNTICQMTGTLSDTQYFKAIFMFKYPERDSKKKNQTGPGKRAKEGSVEKYRQVGLKGFSHRLE